LPPAIVHSYQDLISNSRSLEDVIVPGSIIRIDSPGEDFVVERLLQREGTEAASQEGSPCLEVASIDQLENERGLILILVSGILGSAKSSNVGRINSVESLISDVSLPLPTF
jgi:hypothetical protein